MKREEIEEKILKHSRTLTDDEWLELAEEVVKLEDYQEFRNTLAADVLGQMVGIVQYKRKNADETNS